MQRNPKLKQGWEIIELVVPYAYAVGRIPQRGSCVLVSRPSHDRGIILTTTHVFRSRSEASNCHAIFFETVTLGTDIPSFSVKPVSVLCRPEKFFFTSASTVDDGDALGYTILACDVEAEDLSGDLRSIRPIPLPVLVSRIPPIAVGDVHLMITHVNGANERKSVVSMVAQCCDSHCLYEDADPTTHFASGGPVFATTGDFLGIQHQNGDTTCAMYIRDIVMHLFASTMIGPCGVCVLESTVEQPSDDPSSRLVVQGNPADYTVVPPKPEVNVGCGDYVLDFSEIERKRLQREVNPPPPTLVVPLHHEVWKEWYKPDDFKSLITLLHAFPHSTQLLLMILERMTAHEQRTNIATIGALGGIPILLEALEAHPYDSTLMLAGMTAIGRASLYESNADMIARSEGVGIVSSILKEYINTPEVVQWSLYTLMNLCKGISSAEQNAEALVGDGGIESALHALKQYVAKPHIQKWGASLLSGIIGESKPHFDAFVENNGLAYVADRLREPHLDAETAASYLHLLFQLTHLDVFEAATTYFVQADCFTLIVTALRRVAERAQEGGSTADAFIYAAESVVNILRQQPGQLSNAIKSDVEGELSKACMLWMADKKLHAAAARAFVALGTCNLAERFPHLQLQVN